MLKTFETGDHLSLGFIGGGLNSAVGQTHFSASQMDGRWRLDAGVFSRNAHVNERTGRLWHVAPERIYPDWPTLLDREAGRLDAVAVLTPTPSHADIVCALLERGIPVICEKALTASPADAERVRRAFDTHSNNFLAVTFNYSGYPMIRELRSLVQAGTLGRLHQIHMEMPQEGFARPPAAGSQSAGPQRWRLRDGEVPTICLDLGVHLHHLAYFLTGKETVGIMADFANYSAYPNLVDNAMMWLTFEEGMSGSIWISKTAIGCRNGLRIRLFGENGSAEWYQMEPEVLHLSFLDGSRSTVDRGGKAEVSQAQRYNRFKAGHPSGFLEAFANLYCDIADALLRFRRDGSFDSPFVFGLNHAENGLRLFAAARRASEQRRWQDVFAHQRLKKSA